MVIKFMCADWVQLAEKLAEFGFALKKSKIHPNMSVVEDYFHEDDNITIQLKSIRIDAADSIAVYFDTSSGPNGKSIEAVYDAHGLQALLYPKAALRWVYGKAELPIPEFLEADLNVFLPLYQPKPKPTEAERYKRRMYREQNQHIVFKKPKPTDNPSEGRW